MACIKGKQKNLLYFNWSTILIAILVVICIVAFTYVYMVQYANVEADSKNNSTKIEEPQNENNSTKIEEPPDENNSIKCGKPTVFKNVKHIIMGITQNCDDGKTNLTVDWDYSPKNYTCFGPSLVHDLSTAPKFDCDNIPKDYEPPHRCMSDTIEYTEPIPTYGAHRPVWPKYGEYKYLPTQRWLHSLEHGAVVMLYHPCANIVEVESLKRLVKGCLRKHIITPNSLLDKNRPLALLTWGCKLTMSHVDENLAKQFIREFSLHGPEKSWKNGEFDDQLMTLAERVSDYKDSDLCPEDTKSM